MALSSCRDPVCRHARVRPEGAERQRRPLSRWSAAGADLNERAAARVRGSHGPMPSGAVTRLGFRVVLANMWRAALIAGGLPVAGSATAAQLSGRASAAAGADGRVAHSVVRRECAAGSPMTPLGLSSAGTSGTSVGRWSSPTPLVPAGTATPSIGLAATSGGSVLAGWVQGPPPMVSRAGRSDLARVSPEQQGARQFLHPGGDGRRRHRLGGLRRSAVLAAGPSGSLRACT